MLKEVDKTTSDEPEGVSWMARTPPDIFCYRRRSAFVGRFSMYIIKDYGYILINKSR